jgi:glucokinase
MSKRPKTETLLVGDVGGTRTRLALYARGARRPLAQTIEESAAHTGLASAALPFLAQHGAEPVAAVFGVAGPVKGRAASITNLPWKLDERALARSLGIPRVGLANDLVVSARGCLELRPSDMELLTAERPAKKGLTIGVLAAGTGLGEARLVWAGGRYHALPTEGGHTDFAPRSPIEVELLQFLFERYPDHVSYERVVSGAGLGAIYDFFVAREGKGPDPLAARLAVGDRNAIIADLGLSREDRLAALAVDLFVRIYGAEASNVALRELALGGVYIVGNIGHSLVPARRALFLEGFLAKGRFRELLSGVPIAVVKDPLVGLRGALAMAEELAE